MRIPGLPSLLCVLAVSTALGAPASPSARQADASPSPGPIPENLVIDIRLFEARGENLDRATLGRLHFLFDTEGRDVTANQWLATIAGEVPGVFLAALAFETLEVGRDAARFRLANGARSLETEIRLENYDPSGAFDSRVVTTLRRGAVVLRKLTQEIRLQVSRTTVWSARELEFTATDYLSHFREYRDTEHRGLLYEQLRTKTFFVVMVATPRLLSEGDTSLSGPERIPLPPGTALPELDNPLGAPLYGTTVIGFQLDRSGRPVNPQIIRTTVPEVNPRILGEVSSWTFPRPEPSPPFEKRYQVELDLEIP